MALPKILAVIGPTASGKTDVGIVLARAFGGEVIAADSRTVYRGMDIGTAKPEAQAAAPSALTATDFKEMMQEKPRMISDIPHWGFDLRDPDETFTAAEYQAYADQKIGAIRHRFNQPILVGGTGLYIRAVIDRPSFAEVPPDPGLRLELAQKSNEELVEEVAERDPDTASTIDVHNRRRLERAIEILRATGKRMADSRQFDEPKYDALQIGIDVDRDALYARIDARVDAMIAQGLVDEVRSLRARYGDAAPGMTGIGYRQICAFLRNEISLKDAIIAIKSDSRHYAKRQLTWFQRDERIVWVKTVDAAVQKAADFLDAK